jgi:tetratricopeptide (TPR) repeat protein
MLGSHPDRGGAGGGSQGAGERFEELRKLRDAGRFVEAQRLGERYVGAHPQDGAGHAELGLVHLHAGRAEEALPHFLRAARLAPKVGFHHECAGYALEALGREAEAITAYRTAMACGSVPTVHERLAQLYMAGERHPEAIVCFRKAAGEGEPARRAVNLAMALRLEGQDEEAIATLNRAIHEGGDTPANRMALADALRQRGEFREALEHLEAATEGTPQEAAAAYHAIAHSKRLTEADRAMVAPLKALLEYRSMPRSAHEQAHFALGKIHNDLGEYEAAMRHYDAANRLAGQRRRFDRSQFGASVSRVIASAGAELFAEHGGQGNPSERPVLIVGMPRSGTTLVEQILSSHKDVAGGDELPFWNRAAQAFGQLTDEAAIRQWLGATAEQYLAELERAGPGARRVTDKTPGNFLWLGLLHLALPQARIIHCRRHPVDTCLSNYFTLFMAPLPYAYDKGDLAFYYRAYRRMMAHWREVLPKATLLEVDYEALVSDPEPNIRRMIEFLGLDWDPACLKPEENRRTVRTASLWQVRQKTYRDSVERWRRYEPWLGELASLLDEGEGDGPVHPQSDNAAIPRARKLADAARLDEAIAALQQALRANLDDAVMFCELGLLFLRAGRAEEACEAFWRALGLDPNFAAAHYNLGAALERTGDPAEAERSLRRAIALDPTLGAAHSRLGNLLQAQGKETEARECFERAHERLEAPVDQELEAAKLLRMEGNSLQAEAKLARVLALAPGNALAHAMQGDLAGEAGRFDEAIAHLKRAFELDPARVSALYNISNLRKVTARDLDFVAQMETLLTDRRRTALDRALLHFALGKAYDDLGDEAKAIAHFEAGNARERARLGRLDRDAFTARIDALIAGPLPPPAAGDPGGEGGRALFVVGMPRSGTTLVEQILSAHPDIGAGGELTFWVEAADAAHAGKGSAPGALAAAYLALLERLAPGAARVTDKNPFGFLAVPLIRAALPGARIIHCRRDPIDTCLSIYFTWFAAALPFAYDRDDLAFYYREYRRLMAHWAAVLPGERFLELDYESLTASPEAETRRLIAFTGLPWDERCLAPEANTGTIRTASLWQARQPIYRKARSRRERYARWLGALASLDAPADVRA